MDHLLRQAVHCFHPVHTGHMQVQIFRIINRFKLPFPRHQTHLKRRIRYPLRTHKPVHQILRNKKAVSSRPVCVGDMACDRNLPCQFCKLSFVTVYAPKIYMQQKNQHNTDSYRNQIRGFPPSDAVTYVMKHAAPPHRY